jgi:hypothetical protein
VPAQPTETSHIDSIHGNETFHCVAMMLRAAVALAMGALWEQHTCPYHDTRRRSYRPLVGAGFNAACASVANRAMAAQMWKVLRKFLDHGLGPRPYVFIRSGAAAMQRPA